MKSCPHNLDINVEGVLKPLPERSLVSVFHLFTASGIKVKRRVDLTGYTNPGDLNYIN